MIREYRKKPVVIEAQQFYTNSERGNTNMNEICLWINQGKSADWTTFAAWHNGTNIFINTLEGTMRADCGDWIIRGVAGEFYPCKEDIFEKTYEEVE